ncbi:predicted protein [Thalassiosira pseudonana CCMP1335]|uniref:Uncharacterized protein n=1 Tax=Thalassiosira pseudonana TaxID=35128 RepID=B8CEE2_THAPS|nr:predicted protein [Thalassiosira pseudonana CCMP1335]EED88363.1 predicted protein [Thalassiosira pseudonana CCMP1335]
MGNLPPQPSYPSAAVVNIRPPIFEHELATTIDDPDTTWGDHCQYVFHTFFTHPPNTLLPLLKSLLPGRHLSAYVFRFGGGLATIVKPLWCDKLSQSQEDACLHVHVTFIVRDGTEPVFPPDQKALPSLSHWRIKEGYRYPELDLDMVFEKVVGGVAEIKDDAFAFVPEKTSVLWCEEHGGGRGFMRNNWELELADEENIQLPSMFTNDAEEGKSEEKSIGEVEKQQQSTKSSSTDSAVTAFAKRKACSKKAAINIEKENVVAGVIMERRADTQSSEMTKWTEDKGYKFFLDEKGREIMTANPDRGPREFVSIPLLHQFVVVALLLSRQLLLTNPTFQAEEVKKAYTALGEEAKVEYHERAEAGETHEVKSTAKKSVCKSARVRDSSSGKKDGKATASATNANGKKRKVSATKLALDEEAKSGYGGAKSAVSSRNVAPPKKKSKLEEVPSQNGALSVKESNAKAVKPLPPPRPSSEWLTCE